MEDRKGPLLDLKLVMHPHIFPTFAVRRVKHDNILNPVHWHFVRDYSYQLSAPVVKILEMSQRELVPYVITLLCSPLSVFTIESQSLSAG